MTNDNFQLDMQGLWDRLPTAFSAARGLRRFSGSPNWVVMKWLLGHGSTYSCQICRQLGLDPNAKKGRIEWGIPAPVPLSGITEEMVERVLGSLDTAEYMGNDGYSYPLKGAVWVNDAMHELRALLRQQPPFTPTQTEE